MGIGRASAHQFAENGARALYLCDFDATHLETHKAEIGKSFPGVDVHVRKLDAADEAAIKEVVGHALQTYGRLDVFFANAGITGPAKIFTDISSDEFLHNLRNNVLRYVSDAPRLLWPCLSSPCPSRPSA